MKLVVTSFFSFFFFFFLAYAQVNREFEIRNKSWEKASHENSKKSQKEKEGEKLKQEK